MADLDYAKLYGKAKNILEGEGEVNPSMERVWMKAIQLAWPEKDDDIEFDWRDPDYFVEQHKVHFVILYRGRKIVIVFEGVEFRYCLIDGTGPAMDIEEAFALIDQAYTPK